MKTLRKGTPNELTVPEKGNKIIVETKQDIIDRKYRKDIRILIFHSAFLIITSISLGMCIMYLILTNK
jgi:hypothetical protein